MKSRSPVSIAVIGNVNDFVESRTPAMPFTEEPSASSPPITYLRPIIAGDESRAQKSPTSITIPTSRDESGQLMVYIYAINYRGENRLNNEQVYAIQGERDMNYNYRGSMMLDEVNNSLEFYY